MNQARLRRWAAWGAKNGPDWFVKVAPVLIGIVAFLVAHRARSCVIVNQRRIHGRREVCLEIWDAVQTFVAFAHNLTESLDPERFSIGRRLIVRGRAAADEITRDCGVIIATAHIGPWDSAAMMFSQMSERSVLMLMADEGDAAAAASATRRVGVRSAVIVADLERESTFAEHREGSAADNGTAGDPAEKGAPAQFTGGFHLYLPCPAMPPPTQQPKPPVQARRYAE